MGLRGPKPELTKSVPDIVGYERPKAFQAMSGAAKAVWKRIVDDLPANFFDYHELDQLRAYCELAALNATAAGELKKRGASPVVTVTTRHGDQLARNPWFDIMKETASKLAQLGTKLRLNKNSKLSNAAAANIPTGNPTSRRAGLKFGGRE
jgi:P27 family predicted phage terminase small subunit